MEPMKNRKNMNQGSVLQEQSNMNKKRPNPFRARIGNVVAFRQQKHLSSILDYREDTKNQKEEKLQNLWMTADPGKTDGLALIGSHVRFFSSLLFMGKNYSKYCESTEILPEVDYLAQFPLDSKNTDKVLCGEVITVIGHVKSIKKDIANKLNTSKSISGIIVELLMDHPPTISKDDKAHQDDAAPNNSILLPSKTEKQQLKKKRKTYENLIRGPNKISVQIILPDIKFGILDNQYRWEILSNINNYNYIPDKAHLLRPKNVIIDPLSETATKYYIGDKYDKPRRQEHNWRWYAQHQNRYTADSHQSHNHSSNEYPNLPMRFGKVIKIQPTSTETSKDSNDYKNHSLALVSLQLLWIPEHTKRGRTNHDEPMHIYDDLSTSNQDTKHYSLPPQSQPSSTTTKSNYLSCNEKTLCQVPIENLIVVGRSISRQILDPKSSSHIYNGKFKDNEMMEQNNNGDAKNTRNTFTFIYEYNYDFISTHCYSYDSDTYIPLNPSIITNFDARKKATPYSTNVSTTSSHLLHDNDYASCHRCRRVMSKTKLKQCTDSRRCRCFKCYDIATVSSNDFCWWCNKCLQLLSNLNLNVTSSTETDEMKSKFIAPCCLGICDCINCIMLHPKLHIQNRNDTINQSKDHSSSKRNKYECYICFRPCVVTSTKINTATVNNASIRCHICSRVAHAECHEYECNLSTLHGHNQKKHKHVKTGSSGGFRDKNYSSKEIYNNESCHLKNNRNSNTNEHTNKNKNTIARTKEEPKICRYCLLGNSCFVDTSSVKQSSKVNDYNHHNNSETIGVKNEAIITEKNIFDELSSLIANCDPQNFALPFNFLEPQPSISHIPFTNDPKSSNAITINEGSTPKTKTQSKNLNKKVNLKKKNKVKTDKKEKVNESHQKSTTSEAKSNLVSGPNQCSSSESLTSEKYVCSRILPYDRNKNKRPMTSKLTGFGDDDNYGSSRGTKCARSLLRFTTNKINESKASSRAARANQRRMLKSVVAVAGYVNKYELNMLTLSRREPKLRFGRSPIHHWGVFADEVIRKKEMILEYRGELIGNAVADRREQEYEKSQIGSDYMFRIDFFSVCDATKQGSLARYINASCNPNCYTQIISVHGVKKIMIYAKRDIKRGEELCYDYKFPLEYDETKRIKCYCGGRNCRGYMNWDKRYNKKSTGAMHKI